MANPAPVYDLPDSMYNYITGTCIEDSANRPPSIERGFYLTQIEPINPRKKCCTKVIVVTILSLLIASALAIGITFLVSFRIFINDSDPSIHGMYQLNMSTLCKIIN